MYRKKTRSYNSRKEEGKVKKTLGKIEIFVKMTVIILKYI